MEFFLEHIADHLYRKHGNTLNRHCLVFPSRRAGLYFLKYLSSSIDKPVWAPSVMTINELFRSFSSQQLPGNEILLAELYRVYMKLNKKHESFDDFYSWGDMLLNDFDDVDKYIVNAEMLFRNVSDIKNIDRQFGGLTEDQVSIIRQFWTNFDPERMTREKTGFLGIWSILYQLYSGFRESLSGMNMAYEGMIFRSLAESSSIESEIAAKWDNVHFIGFNALNECEKAVMKKLRKADLARFYWDYDVSYISGSNQNSAGFFMRDNLKQFGNDMPDDWSYNTNLSGPAGIINRSVIEASSNMAQVKAVSGLLKRLKDLNPQSAHHTAVVLADESLLLPLLTSLPDDIGDINITMGYPLKQTVVYSFIRLLLDLQRSSKESGLWLTFGHKEVIRLLTHPLMQLISSGDNQPIVKKLTDENIIRVPASLLTVGEARSLIFRRASGAAELSLYLRDILSVAASVTPEQDETQDADDMQANIRNEFIYRVVLALNRLDSIVSAKDISFTGDTYIKLLDKMLRMQSVPFSGEPLSGVQVMGILETRALDFKNLIILSVNEGVMPAASAGSSFIPFSLREAFGIPSINHQESIYAYHFYRLLERAGNVTFLYNSGTEGLRSGEMSRFLTQMKFDDILKPSFSELRMPVTSGLAAASAIEHTAQHNEKLASVYGDGRHIISPSALNTWLNCSMKFYYRYVCRLREKDEISSDIDAAILGNIVHAVMRKIYDPFGSSAIGSEKISAIAKDNAYLEKLIDETIAEEFSQATKDEITGNEIIVRDVLLNFIRRILRYDSGFAPFTIQGLEKNVSFRMDRKVTGLPYDIVAGGQADRIDIVEGTMRIVDYKTGNVSDSVAGLEELFGDDRKKDHDAWLQTLLYCEAIMSSETGKVVRPSVYKIKKLNNENVSDRFTIKQGRSQGEVLDSYSLVREEFVERLANLLLTIFNSESPFVKTEDQLTKCRYCSYRQLCMR